MEDLNNRKILLGSMERSMERYLNRCKERGKEPNVEFYYFFLKYILISQGYDYQVKDMTPKLVEDMGAAICSVYTLNKSVKPYEFEPISEKIVKIVSENIEGG